MTRAAPAAFLALWNSISRAALQPEYETWHTFEHVPERIGLPGFIEARRYRSVTSAPNPPDYFTCYWLDSLEVLNSPRYLELFAHPTPWSARMRLELRNFFRLSCSLDGAYGQSMASQLATIHLRGEGGLFPGQLQRQLAQRVQHGNLVCAQWGSVERTQAIPIANRVDAPVAWATGSEVVVMLQGLEASGLREQARQLLQALSPVAAPVSPPEFFELLSQVRQDELTSPVLSHPHINQRQAPRPDLFQKFQTGDTP